MNETLQQTIERWSNEVKQIDQELPELVRSMDWEDIPDEINEAMKSHYNELAARACLVEFQIDLARQQSPE